MEQVFAEGLSMSTGVTVLSVRWQKRSFEKGRTLRSHHSLQQKHTKCIRTPHPVVFARLLIHVKFFINFFTEAAPSWTDQIKPGRMSGTGARQRTYGQFSNLLLAAGWTYRYPFYQLQRPQNQGKRTKSASQQNSQHNRRQTACERSPRRGTKEGWNKTA